MLSSDDVASSNTRIGAAFENGARDRHPLLFASGQFQAPLAHFRLVAFRQLADEGIEVGETNGGGDVSIAGLRVSVAHVLENSVIKQHRILWHDANGAAQGVFADIADIHAADGNADLH